MAESLAGGTQRLAASTPEERASAALILYWRDREGVPFAVEEITATSWKPRLAFPPDPATADARIVHLVQGPLPVSVPSWLAVDIEAPRVTDIEFDYVAEEVVTSVLPSEVTERLWNASPYYRSPSASLEEFVRAGAAALRYPAPPPLEPERQAEALRAFAREREEFEPLLPLRSIALERWLHVRYTEPEHFAEAVLIARIQDASPGDAALIRFLREAAVPRALPETADLAVDRMVLLEQASPWRYLEGVPMTAAFAAAQSWQRRYRRAYRAHYQRLVGERDAVLLNTEAHTARIATLERLNDIAALGDPEGEEAVAAARACLAALVAMPAEPDAIAATTAGLALGASNPRATAYLAAVHDVERALSTRLRRLSGALAVHALEQDGDLRAVLDAIALSEVDHLDRVLDDRLAARIEGLLGAAARSPLTVVAQQFPEVTLANLEAAVDEFRRAARHAIDGSLDGRAALVSRPDPVEPHLDS